MRVVVLAAVLVVVCVAAVAGSAAHRGDVHSMALKHLNALPGYYAMAARKIAHAQQQQANGQRHLLLQTCERMTEERDGELAQIKDFADILPAACNKYLESHGIKVIDLQTCPNATVDSGSITGLGDGACCDQDDQCGSGVCDRSTRTCTLACDIDGADICADHQGGWNAESYCEVISGDPTPPSDCTFCHMTYDCGTLGSVDNFCMACPSYVGEVTEELVSQANCLEENSIDDFAATQNDDDTVFDGANCVADPGWSTVLTCDHGYLTECVMPAYENINILLGPDCLDFPCGLIPIDYYQSELDFLCAGNGDGEYCAAIMQCALGAGNDENVDDCTYAREAGCCANTWVTYWEENGNQTLVNMILDLEAECGLDNSSICEPCYGPNCTPYVEPVVDDYEYDTEADDLKPYAATLIALFCIIFLAFLFLVAAVVKGLCPCCPSGDNKRSGGGGGDQPRARAASPKQAAGGGEVAMSGPPFTAVATTEPAPAPAKGAVVPQMDDTTAPAQV